jgi:copper transport protein
MRTALLSLAAAFLAGTLAASAAAHANLVRTEPGAGTVLAQGPLEVRLIFDDAIRPIAGIQAIRNGGPSVLRGQPHTAPGSSRVLEVPLRANLPAGDYTVRWRIRSDDGHVIAGVLAFGVGSGRPPPTPALSAGNGGPPAGDVFRRFFFFAGVLLAAGGIAFLLLVSDAWRFGTLVPLVGFALALSGSQPDLSPSSRFERFNDVAAVAAGSGIVILWAVAFGRSRLRFLAVLPALTLLLAPTLRGHALDPGQVRPLAVAADFVHLAAAAFWVGGLAQLAVWLAFGKVPTAAIRRFSAGALVAVLALGATGVLRAIGELSAVDQLWRTGYGRTLLVKTAMLAGLLALGWVNRARMRSAVSMRRGLAAELVVLAGVVAAVALLTDLRPGRHAALGAPGRLSSKPSQLRLPPRAALVLARQAGSLAVGLAVQPRGHGVELLASVLGPDQLGVNGLPVSFRTDKAFTRARPCGGGCYSALAAERPRTVTVRVGSAAVRFPLPSGGLRPASRLIDRAERTWRSLQTLVLHERLASSPRDAISSVFEFQAPNRMTYRIRGGPAGIVIGASRWDKVSPTDPWVRSPQDPIRQPDPFWTSVSNAYLLRTTGGKFVVSFLDRGIPAWFTATIDRRTYRTLALRMTAAAHFMRHRYGPFNAPLEIRPPA